MRVRLGARRPEIDCTGSADSKCQTATTRILESVIPGRELARDRRAILQRRNATGDGEDPRELPPLMRKTNLARLLRERTDGIFIVPFDQGAIGPELFRVTCNTRLSGVKAPRSA
jgi:hypothetical protein